MDKDLAAGPIGSEAKYDLAFKGGKLCAELDYAHGAIEGGLVIKLDASAIIDALEAAIPNVIAKEILEAAKAALKA